MRQCPACWAMHDRSKQTCSDECSRRLSRYQAAARRDREWWPKPSRLASGVRREPAT